MVIFYHVILDFMNYQVENSVKLELVKASFVPGRTENLVNCVPRELGSVSN